MKTYEIEARIKQAAAEYEIAVKAELQEDLGEEEDRNRKMLLQVATSNSSTWSGGCSTSNMLEQIKRETALRLLDDYLRSRK